MQMLLLLLLLGRFSHVLLCATPETAAHPWDSPGKNTGVGDTTLITESEDKLKSLLKKVKEESEKAGLKFNIQKTKITASGPIASWEIDGETMETVTDFIFLGSKITTDGDCSHEIKTPWKESYDQPAAASKLLQSCPTLCDPIDGRPPGSAVPGILQAKVLEWVAISFSNA